MKSPTLHISGSNGQHRCGTNADDKNWPDKYLNDKVARTLEICETCMAMFIKSHGQNKMDDILTNLRANTMQNTEDYQVEDYNDEVMNQVIDITPTRECVKTLRMYLEVEV
tara:strand:+ start:97 stop:429 length:333 start_codon:yes stop_codon:yes gene_type:complete